MNKFKSYAIKEIATGNIKILKTTSISFNLSGIYPDFVTGSGTTQDPYVSTPTVELLGELPKDSSGKYTHPDRYFRDAWEDDGSGNIQINLVIARNKVLDSIRVTRDVMLKKSDDIFVEELSKGLSTANINSDKQILRDLPASASTALDQINDTNLLKTYDPFSGLTLNYNLTV